MDEVIGLHRMDPQENPAGGITEHTGMKIQWQDGPLGRGADRKPQNGAFVEEVIWAAIDRLMFYQTTKYGCFHNDMAIRLLRLAVDILNWRTKMRESRGVEGTNIV